MTAVRDLAFGEMWNIVELAKSCITYRSRANGPGVNDHTLSFDDLRMWLMYAVEHPSRGRGHKGWRKPTMTTNARAALVAAWVPIIRGLSTAHGKATVDRCEFDMETHLRPLLVTKVADIRAFYAALVTALKADATIPFFVWALFESWGDVILKRAADEDVRALKKELAAEIVDLVEADVAPDVPKAIAAALQWRSAEQLIKVRDAVKSGAKPRLVGKESCLFLEVELPDGHCEVVML